jgi:hypothetical protein
MSPLRDFVATLARAGKSFKEIQETVTAAYGDTGLKKMQIYAIIKNVKEGKPTSDQRKSNGTHKIRSRRLSPMLLPPSNRIGAKQSGDSRRRTGCQKAPSIRRSKRI